MCVALFDAHPAHGGLLCLSLHNDILYNITTSEHNMTSLPSIHPQKTAYAVKKKTKKAEISEDCLPSEQNGIESRSHKNVIASKGCKSWNALERIDSAVKEYYSCPSKPSIRRIAKIHGLETNLLKLHLDCSERDDLFFDKFSLNFHVDNVIDSFQHVPLRGTQSSTL